MSKYFSKYDFIPEEVDLSSYQGLLKVYSVYVRLASRRKHSLILLPCDFFVHLSTYYDPDLDDPDQDFLADFMEDVTNPLVKDFHSEAVIAEDDLAIFQQLYEEQAFNPNLMGKLAAATHVRIHVSGLQDVRTIMKDRWLNQRNKQLKFLKDVLLVEHPTLRITHDKHIAQLEITSSDNEKFFLRQLADSQLFQHLRSDVYNCVRLNKMYCDISHEVDIATGKKLRVHLGDLALERVSAVVPKANRSNEYISASKPVLEYL